MIKASLAISLLRLLTPRSSLAYVYAVNARSQEDGCVLCRVKEINIHMGLQLSHATEQCHLQSL
jgi:hypothetical protein